MHRLTVGFNDEQVEWIESRADAEGRSNAEIVRRVGEGDLVVTSDIPLAAEVIDKGAHVLSPRGEVMGRETIRARLQMRDFMETLRGSGIHTGGPAGLTHADRKAFADALDRYLA